MAASGSRAYHLTRQGRRVRAVVVSVLAVAVVLVAGTIAVRSLNEPVVLDERCTATAGGQSYDLDPDQAANAATIAAIAVHRGLPARAATIAIATAIQESDLRNIDYGDRDSVGLFQQRPSQGWGTVEQILDPIYATNAFYDVLVKIAGYEAMEITDASHRVQRSAFPGAVADHEPEGRAFASALTGYSPAGLDCRLRQVTEVEEQQAGDDGLLPRAAVVRDALVTQLGDVSWTPAGDGAQLRHSFGEGDDAQRLAWTAAAWALAQAGARDIVSVTVDDVGWRRDHPQEGWAEVRDQEGTEAAAANTVTIEVASAS